MKMLKLLTTALLLICGGNAMAGSSFESIKEEMWLKGGSALSVQASYTSSSDQASLAQLQQNSWDQEIDEENFIPEELEIGLSVWLAAK